MNGPKILLVVSDKTRRPAFAGTLKALGCQVLTTITAENALAALEGFCPNVILADMDLEDMKSSNFLKKIKENAKCKGMEIVSYTRLLNYKLTNPELLTQPEQKTEDSVQALEILRENVALVPGEIILWVGEALTKQNMEIPPLLTAAILILRKPKA